MFSGIIPPRPRIQIRHIAFIPELLRAFVGLFQQVKADLLKQGYEPKYIAFEPLQLNISSDFS